MGKNLGGATEDDFEGKIRSLGKAAYLYRLVDAAEIRGRTGIVGRARAQPSDYLLTYKGKTVYAEVKGCEKETSFPLSYLRDAQTSAAKQVVAAGGEYLVFIKRLAVGNWYCVPYPALISLPTDGAKSVKWEALAPFKWEM